jgi:uncharacterized protein (UPF0332 family)
VSEISDLLEKAARAANSARLLLDAGDRDGACSRAYYAMFDAARAALITVGFAPEDLKTHGSVIGQFGLHMVKTGLVAREVGKALNDVQEIRQLADYLPAEVPTEKAEWAVEQAHIFVSAVNALPSVRQILL